MGKDEKWFGAGYDTLVDCGLPGQQARRTCMGSQHLGEKHLYSRSTDSHYVSVCAFVYVCISCSCIVVGHAASLTSICPT